MDALSVTETGNQSSLGATVEALQKAVGAPNPDTTGILNEVTAAGGSGILGLLSGLIQSLPTLNVPHAGTPHNRRRGWSAAVSRAHPRRSSPRSAS